MAEELSITNQAGAMQYSTYTDKPPLGVQVFEGSQFAPLKPIRSFCVMVGIS